MEVINGHHSHTIVNTRLKQKNGMEVLGQKLHDYQQTETFNGTNLAGK